MKRRKGSKISLANKIALAVLLISLLSILCGFISVGANALSDIETNTDNMNKVSESIINHEKRIVVIETHYEHISYTLDKIDKKLDEVE